MDEPLTIRRPLKLTFAALLLLAGLVGVVSDMRAVGQGPGRPEPADFNVFHLAGTLVWSGRFADAYAMATMRPLEAALTGSDAFLPWSYPPLFGLVLAPLARLPLWLAQSLFVSASLALYLAVTRRLAGPQAWPVWLALVPSLALNLQAGQNGLLTGGLAGAAALALLRRRTVAAGAAIAALAIKPHLAVMFPVILVLQRRWHALLVAGAGAAALTALSFAALGWDVFAAFLRSFSEVGRLMAAGAYPLQRMTSLCVALLSWGVAPLAALAVHAAVAVAILAAAVRTLAGADDPRVAIGLAIATTQFVSPYIYDYDATVFGVGLVLLAPALAARLPARRYGLLLAGVAASLAAGLLCSRFGLDKSFGGPMLLCVQVILLRVLGRATGVVPAASFARPAQQVSVRP